MRFSERNIEGEKFAFGRDKFSFEAGKFASRRGKFSQMSKFVKPKYSLTAHGSSWDDSLQMYSGTEKVARYLWFSYIIY